MKIFSRRTIFIIIVATCLAVAVIVAAVWQGRRVYDTYDIDVSFSIDGAETQNFLPFDGGLVGYSRDGAQYYDSQGLTIWNESYNMQSPVVRTDDERLIVYDRQGSTIVVMSPEKELTIISTNHPIVTASVASNGNVAVLTQDSDTGYINLYGDDGSSLAGGQVHLEQTGYPMAIGLSHDGQRLVASFQYTSDSSLGARLNIYDFSSAGDRHKDNITATYTYDDTICPQVGFFSDGSAYAFTDSGVRLYSSASTPKELTEVKADYDIDSVVAGDSHFGLIHRDSDNRSILTVYSSNGKESYTKKLRKSYDSCVFTGTDLLIVKSGRMIEILDTTGRKRFGYRFPDEVIAFTEAGDSREYFLVQRDTSAIIRVS